MYIRQIKIYNKLQNICKTLLRKGEINWFLFKSYGAEKKDPVQRECVFFCLRGKHHYLSPSQKTSVE